MPRFPKLNKASYGLIFIISIIAISACIQYPRVFFTEPASLEAHAAKIFAKCSMSSSLRDRCYDEEIPKLMDVISMEDAFGVTKIIQSQDDSYWFCHTLGHALSEREYNKDPSKWRDVVDRCPVGMCSNGCIHGTIQEHFASAELDEEQIRELQPDLVRLCEKRPSWNPTLQQTSSCYHEIGHLSMYLTGADVNAATAVCEAVGIKEDGRNYLQTCYEGIFMQIFQPREPEDFALIYNIVPLKKNLVECDQYTNGIDKGICWERGWRGELSSFCGQFPQEIQWGCFREAWIVGNKEKELETSEDIIDYCSYSMDPREHKLCYNKLFFSIAVRFEFQASRMNALCTGMPEEIKAQCFANMASRMVETDKNLIERAVGICEYAQKFELENECYKELLYYSTFSVHPESEEFIQYCSYLPDFWNARCRDRI